MHRDSRSPGRGSAILLLAGVAASHADQKLSWLRWKGSRVIGHRPCPHHRASGNARGGRQSAASPTPAPPSGSVSLRWQVSPAFGSGGPVWGPTAACPSRPSEGPVAPNGLSAYGRGGGSAHQAARPGCTFPFHLSIEAPALCELRRFDGPLSSMRGRPMSDDVNIRHAEKMKKIKAARDRMMETKTEEKGLIMVHTGAGKGKSSSGFGMIMRCIAHQMPCAVVQFIKGTWSTGEKGTPPCALRRGMPVHRLGRGLHLGNPGPRARHRRRNSRVGAGERADPQPRDPLRPPRRDQHRAPLRLPRHRRGRGLPPRGETLA